MIILMIVIWRMNNVAQKNGPSNITKEGDLTRGLCNPTLLNCSYKHRCRCAGTKHV